MRARLLEATVACLADVGYAKTTTTRVCAEAGVSRGAQVHYFPFKEDLLVGAVEHVFEQRRGAFRASLQGLRPGPGRLEDAVDRMWDAVEGGPTEAWLELVVAARTDAALRPKVEAATERLRRAAAEEFAHLAEAAALPQDALLLASAVMDGLVVQQLAGLGADRRRRVLRLLKTLIPLASIAEGGAP